MVGVDRPCQAWASSSRVAGGPGIDWSLAPATRYPLSVIRDPSLEIMRCGGLEREGRQALNHFRPDMDGAGAHLQDSLDQEKIFLGNHQAAPFKKLRVNNHVGDTGFILEADENNALCRSRPLTANRQPGNF